MLLCKVLTNTFFIINTNNKILNTQLCISKKFYRMFHSRKRLENAYKTVKEKCHCKLLSNLVDLLLHILGCSKKITERC